MADVFISYHEKSAGELVEQIADALEAAGISCWCARRNLSPGATFSDYIPQAIRNCNVFLLVLNEGSNQSEHVKNELNLAFRRINHHEQITLVPFQVDNCVISDSVDYFINRFQIINGTPPNAQRIRELVNAVADILGRKPLQAEQMLPHYLKDSTKIIKSGSCGKTVTYALYESGLLAIFGVGPMYFFIFDSKKRAFNTPWWNERKSIFTVWLQEGVTEIGAGAFYDCVNLRRVTIPDSMTCIAIGAFSGCESLESASISAHSDIIGTLTFPENTTIVRRQIRRK